MGPMTEGSTHRRERLVPKINPREETMSYVKTLHKHVRALAALLLACAFAIPGAGSRAA